MAKSNKPKRPTRDEFVLEELGNQLTEAYNESSEIELTVWAWEDTVRGSIEKMDSRTGLVHITKNGELIKVPFMDIMQVNYPRD